MSITSPKTLNESQKIFHFTMFAFLWAIAILWHYLTEPVDSPSLWILFIPCILVLAHPQQGIFLLGMAVAHIMLFMSDPAEFGLSNHLTLQFLINIFLLCSGTWVVLTSIIQQRRFRLQINQWFDLFRPFLILAIIIVYLVSVLHKLNTSFLDPNYSDVTRLITFFYDADHLLFVPDLLPKQTWFLHLVIVGTLIIETVIPICLILRPLRLIGIFLGFIFHMILSIRLYPPMGEFPTLLFAVYILALPDSTIPLLENVWKRLQCKEWFKQSKLVFIAFFAWFFFWLPLVFQWPEQQQQLNLRKFEMWSYFWVAYLSIYFAIMTYLMIKTRGGFNISKGIVWLQRKYLVAYIFPLVIILNGLAPYFGIKNDGTWNMYSSLRAESHHTNHLFMPILYVAPYLEVVCITDSSFTNLKRSAYSGELVTYIEFLRWANDNPNESVEFYYDNVYYEIEQIGDHEVFGRELTWLEKILPIQSSGSQFKYWLWCQQYDPYNEDKSQEINLKEFSYIPWKQ